MNAPQGSSARKNARLIIWRSQVQILPLLPLMAMLVLLSGCVGDQGRQGDLSVNPMPVPAPKPVATPDDVARVEQAMTDRISASTNASQQAFSGLGAQISKMAENVDAAVVKVQTDVRTSAQANAEANVRLNGKVDVVASAVTDLNVKVGVAVDVSNRIDVQVKAQAQVMADLKSQIAALGAAQVGLKNDLQQTTTTMSAGRDTIQQINGATKEWVQILKNEKDAQVRETQITAGLILAIVTALLEFSRRRAEARAKLQTNRRENP